VHIDPANARKFVPPVQAPDNGAPLQVPLHVGERCGIAARRLLTGRRWRFSTQVGGDLRTEGVVIDRPDRSALDLAGLDTLQLFLAATSQRNAAASGKLVLIGRDGVAVYQLTHADAPALVHCGQATLAVASVVKRMRHAFNLFGPEGQHVRVVQYQEGCYTRQWWQIGDVPVRLCWWRDLPVAFCSVLNEYAVIVGALPKGVSSADARRELFGADRLTCKLAVVTPGDSGVPHVAVETAAGAHGAIPATCAATLAILACRTAIFATVLSRGTISHPSKSGGVVLALPRVSEAAAGSLMIDMPSAHVLLSTLTRRRK
jgi:hypothetical protein